MPPPYRLPLVAAALAIIYIHASTSLFRTLRRRRAKGGAAETQLYADRDGVASAESMRRYSTRWQTFLTVFVAASGCSVSLARAVLVTVHGGEIALAWLTWAIWVSTAFLSVLFLWSSNSTSISFSRGSIVYTDSMMGWRKSVVCVPGSPCCEVFMSAGSCRLAAGAAISLDHCPGAIVRDETWFQTNTPL